jgi:hypothetical protein
MVESFQVGTIGQVLFPAMVPFPEEKDHEKIKKKHSTCTMENPSFSTDSQVREFPS